MTKLSKCFFAALLCIAATCSGCLAVKLRDRSSDAKYREGIGRTFVLKSDFAVYGVRMDLRSKTPDFYQMIPSNGPGISGPEKMDLGRLAANTRVRLIAAYEEEWGAAPLYEVAVVEPVDPRFNNIPIRINNARGFHLYQNNNHASGAPSLNEEWFAESISQ